MPDKPEVLGNEDLAAAVHNAIRLTVAKEERGKELKADRDDLKYTRDCIAKTLEAKKCDGFQDIQLPVTYGNKTRQGPWKVEMIEQRFAPKFATEAAWLEVFLPEAMKLGASEAATRGFLVWMWHATHDRTQLRHVLRITEGGARNLVQWK